MRRMARAISEVAKNEPILVREVGRDVAGYAFHFSELGKAASFIEGLLA